MGENSYIINGDCLEELQNVPDKSIDLIFTSPPYADRRKGQYDSISEHQYVAWFLPIAFHLKRVLKDDGSFFLNIKPHTADGQRSLYVFDLVLSLVRQFEFYFVDEYCWTKNPFPGKYDGRFKNGFEPIYHFSKSHPRYIKFNPLACGTPIQEVSRKRAFRKQSGAPESGSGMTGMNTTNMRHIETVRPSNVINVNNVLNQNSANKHHPAVFPAKLAEFFIKTFSNEEDTVLDPFAGSGVTGVVAEELNRKCILIEKKKEYYDKILERFNEKPEKLF